MVKQFVIEYIRVIYIEISKYIFGVFFYSINCFLLKAVKRFLERAIL